MVFFDRDGTLNVERGYLRRVDDLELIPQAPEAIRRIHSAGWAAVLVTNQSGAARGYFSLAHIDALNDRLVGLLAAQGAALHGVYTCPHLPHSEGGVTSPLAIDCACRKPLPGMAVRAAVELDLDLGLSVVIGDKAADIGLARAIGARAVLVRTGFGLETLRAGHAPDLVADDVGDAVQQVLALR